MYESDDEKSKREFYHHESNNKTNIENIDSMSRHRPYIGLSSRYTYIRYVF